VTLKQKIVIKNAFKFKSQLFYIGEDFITCGYHELRHDENFNNENGDHVNHITYFVRKCEISVIGLSL